MVNGKLINGLVLVELDSTQNMPLTIKTARIARGCLLKQGVALKD